MNHDQFPLLQAGARNPVRFIEAVKEILNGVEVGSIRNVVLNDAKFVLSNAASDGWKKHVSEPFLYGGKAHSQSQAFQELSNSILIMGLYDMIATSKKLAKTKATGPAVDAMREFVAQALPLAEAVVSLKSKVVKGRAPSAGPSKPENPNKDVKTCPCCFRQIAVVRDLMAHYGYERPGTGWQTASCPGVRFKPLEVSSEGLEWLIATLSEQLAGLKAVYKARDKKTSLPVLKGHKLMEVVKGTPEWDREFQYFVAKLEREIKSLKWELPRLQKRLAEWKPGVQK